MRRPIARDINQRKRAVGNLVSNWALDYPNFTPLSLNPALWLDASDSTTITQSSGSVSQWNDKSGNGRNATQATASLQPITGSATQNGLNVLSFSSKGIGVDWTGLSRNIFYSVAFNGSANQGAFGFGTNAYPLYISGTNQIAAYFGAGPGVSTTNTTTSFRIAATAMTTTSSRAWLNGILTTGGNNATGSGGLFNIGQGGANNLILNGVIAEIVVCLDIPTSGQIASLLRYLGQKWGVKA